MSDDRENQVRQRAHSLWEGEGRPEGRELHHWLSAERETADAATSAHPSDVDKAAGPSHGSDDFGGHDAEAEGSAASGVGGQKHPPGTGPKQAATDEPEAGEQRAPSGFPKS
jgi:hypothetical protein